MHLDRRGTSLYFYKNWVYYLIASVILLVILIVATVFQLKKYGKIATPNSTVKEEVRKSEIGEKQMMKSELEGSRVCLNSKTEAV
jgi:hypothetical protein